MLLFFLVGSTTSNAINLKIADEVKVERDDLMKPIYIVDASNEEGIDLDPLTNIKINFTLKEIRAFDRIDLTSEADFYVKVTINNKVSESKVWQKGIQSYDHGLGSLVARGKSTVDER